MNELSVSLIQVPIVWENPIENQNNIWKLIHDTGFPDTDLIVLPEMWTTGFSMNTNLLAEDMTGPSVQWMLKVAKEKNCAVTGSIIIKDKDLFFNRLIFAKENGSVEYYDKRHCFSLASENLYFSSGNEIKIIEWRSWRFCPMICYDLRFPVWSRNTQNYDALIYVAQFPEKRRQAWMSLLKARAIENVSFSIGVNGIGLDGNGIKYAGDSAIFNYEGQSIIELHSEIGFKNAIISKEKLSGFRRAYPFLNDQDQFNII